MNEHYELIVLAGAVSTILVVTGAAHIVSHSWRWLRSRWRVKERATRPTKTIVRPVRRMSWN